MYNVDFLIVWRCNACIVRLIEHVIQSRGVYLIAIAWYFILHIPSQMAFLPCILIGCFEATSAGTRMATVRNIEVIVTDLGDKLRASKSMFQKKCRVFVVFF